MREFAKISPQFWINEPGRRIKALGTEVQLLALYLTTNPHATMIGIYYLPIVFMAHETGISIGGATKGLQDLCEIGFCSYDPGSEYIWVHEMASEQLGELKPGDNRIKAINEFYLGLPELPFLITFYERYADMFYLEKHASWDKPLRRAFEAPSKLLRSKEKEIETEKEKEISMSGKPDVDLFNHEMPAQQGPPVMHDDRSAAQQKPPSSSIAPPPLKSQAEEVLQFLNDKVGRAYRPVETNLKLIMARLRTGATMTDCRQVIAKKTREWKGNPKMAEYLRPATLFNATKFEQYVGELVLPQEESIDECH